MKQFVAVMALLVLCAGCGKKAPLKAIDGALDPDQFPIH